MLQPTTCPRNINIISIKMAKLSGADIAAHNSPESCWVIIHGKAYDVTEFLPEQYVAHTHVHQLCKLT